MTCSFLPFVLFTPLPSSHQDGIVSVSLGDPLVMTFKPVAAIVNSCSGGKAARAASGDYVNAMTAKMCSTAAVEAAAEAEAAKARCAAEGYGSAITERQSMACGQTNNCHQEVQVT